MNSFPAARGRHEARFTQPLTQKYALQSTQPLNLQWFYHEIFVPSLLQILPDGETGRVAFDAMGDRINAEYRVVNVQRKDDKREVGTYDFSKVGIIGGMCE